MARPGFLQSGENESHDAGGRTPRVLARVLLILCLFSIAGCETEWSVVSGTLLSHGTLYPRAIRLAHGPADSVGTIIVSTNGRIFQSRNGGLSFTYLADVMTRSGSEHLCCATLYELPVAVGSLPAGTLLSAASDRHAARPVIEVYISTDQGSTWTYSSTPVQGDLSPRQIVGRNSTPGIWEPEFEVAQDGSLVMFWSDETDDCCSQKIAQIRTYNGTAWRDLRNTVSSRVPGDRPGMVTVSKLPNGHFFMSYEICGPPACKVFSRTSKDGWNFGDTADLGLLIHTRIGQYLRRAPLNVWSPPSSRSNGALLVVGQRLYESNGSPSAQSGTVLLMSPAPDGQGTWHTIDAAVHVAADHDDPCTNYSSAILPASDGTSILELASSYRGGKNCVTYFATAPMRTDLELRSQEGGPDPRARPSLLPKIFTR